MPDLISRQAAITAICEDGTWLERQECKEITLCERKQRDADILSELPTIDAIEVRRGRWIYICNSKLNGLKICECTVCHRRTYGSLDFCGNCGARMGGGSKNAIS